MLRKLASNTTSVVSAATRANDADGVLIGGGDFPFAVEEEGGVWAFAQVTGPKRGVGCEDADVVLFAEGEFGFGIGVFTPVMDNGGDFGADSRDGL